VIDFFEGRIGKAIDDSRLNRRDTYYNYRQEK